MLLAIDTGVGTSVAVLAADGTAAVRTSGNTRAHAELIGVFIQELLAELGTPARGIDTVAVGVGPGPFTGLRVGIAAAVTFALAHSLPIHPVITHDALAWGKSAELLVLTDAKRNELFFSRYTHPDADGLPRRILGPKLVTREQINQIPGNFSLLTAHHVDALSLARLARARIALRVSPEPVAAIYLRSPDVGTVTVGA